MKLAILGSGFIARFYADALVGQRRKDVITKVYSRSIANAKSLPTIIRFQNLPITSMIV